MFRLRHYAQTIHASLPPLRSAARSERADGGAAAGLNFNPGAARAVSGQYSDSSRLLAKKHRRCWGRWKSHSGAEPDAEHGPPLA